MSHVSCLQATLAETPQEGVRIVALCPSFTRTELFTKEEFQANFQNVDPQTGRNAVGAVGVMECVVSDVVGGLDGGGSQDILMMSNWL